MRFIVDIVMSGYKTEEEHKEACKTFIEEQLTTPTTDVVVEEI